ncbi:MAG: restriction endonuclease subunit S [Patescibacteria group bacterium]|nr:restriction endonuclease subunit S [Patescibacteria group bacterium]
MTITAAKNNWNNTKLSALVDYIVDNRGKNPQAFYNEGIPVIDNFLITGTRSVALANARRFIDEKTFHDFIRKYLKEKDVLVTLVGNGFGNVALAPKKKSVIIQNTIGIRCGKGCLNEFLYYFLFFNKNKITELDRGAAQPSVKVSDLLNIELSLPPIQVQESIVNHLSPYDDLIENNTRRIKILELMMQVIYTEWFVNYRFPNHEKIKMVDSGTEFGKIPEGWKICNLESILDIKSGHAFKGKDYVTTGLYRIITIKNIHDGKFISDFNYIAEIPPKMPDHCRLNDGDILLSLTGNVGRVCIVYGENLLLNQRVGKIVPKDAVYKSFVYSLFRSESFKKKLELLSNGVAQQNLSPVQTLNLKMVLPPISLVTEYENLVSALIDLGLNLNKQMDSLSNSKDALLSKLVTGNINI